MLQQCISRASTPTHELGGHYDLSRILVGFQSCGDGSEGSVLREKGGLWGLCDCDTMPSWLHKPTITSLFSSQRCEGHTATWLHLCIPSIELAGSISTIWNGTAIIVVSRDANANSANCPLVSSGGGGLLDLGALRTEPGPSGDYVGCLLQECLCKLQGQLTDYQSTERVNIWVAPSPGSSTSPRPVPNTF